MLKIAYIYLSTSITLYSYVRAQNFNVRVGLSSCILKHFYLQRRRRRQRWLHNCLIQYVHLFVGNLNFLKLGIPWRILAMYFSSGENYGTHDYERNVWEDKGTWKRTLRNHVHLMTMMTWILNIWIQSSQMSLRVICTFRWKVRLERRLEWL